MFKLVLIMAQNSFKNPYNPSRVVKKISLSILPHSYRNTHPISASICVCEFLEHPHPSCFLFIPLPTYISAPRTPHYPLNVSISLVGFDCRL